MMESNNERMPYWFTEDQIHSLARIVGNDIDSGSNKLRSVNDEIGVLKAREEISSIRKHLSHLYQEKKLMIMLTPDECKNILSTDIPQEIREVLVDEL